ncbi:MAG: hypothetical protein WBC35_14220, partial [Saprospiraceae bacterium]
LYTEEQSFLGGIHSSGFNIGYRKGIIKKYYLTTYYHIDFGSLKHPKEYHQSLRTQSILHNIPSANGFVYGKQNSFYALRGGLGAKRYFSEKAKRKGVAVALSYEAGPALGITKPYYLDIRKYDGDRYKIEAERYSEETKADFLDLNSIAGSSSFLKGITHLGIIPGIQGKASLNFSFGEQEQFVKALEAGMLIDVYARKIPIMVETPNTAYFINFYVGVEIGKRK